MSHRSSQFLTGIFTGGDNIHPMDSTREEKPLSLDHEHPAWLLYLLCTCSPYKVKVSEVMQMNKILSTFRKLTLNLGYTNICVCFFRSIPWQAQSLVLSVDQSCPSHISVDGER